MGGGLDLRAGTLWAWSSLADSARDAETHTDRLQFLLGLRLGRTVKVPKAEAKAAQLQRLGNRTYLAAEKAAAQSRKASRGCSQRSAS